MDNFKLTYYKHDDIDAVLEKIKGIMKSYDMYMVKSGGDKYVFENDISYTRSFIVKSAGNQWVLVHDDDESQAEELAVEMSGLLSSPALVIGINKDLLYYTYFADGEQLDQYLSTLDYYEYEITDETEEEFKGNAEVFKNALSHDKIQKLQNILDGCREKTIGFLEGYKSIITLLGETKEKEETVDDNIEEGDEETPGEGFEAIDLMYSEDLTYVDFHSVNIMTQDRERTVEAVVKIAERLGYKKVDDFNGNQNEKKGFFKKLLSSVSQKKRLRFYISPSTSGWVTLVGEQEILYGDGTSEWEFLNIDEQLSEYLEAPVLNIHSDSESWGFEATINGRRLYEFNSDQGPSDMDGIEKIVKVDVEKLEGILERETYNYQDTGRAINDFCHELNISNYKINIPMDLSEKEFHDTIISKLPGSSGFAALKFVEDK